MLTIKEIRFLEHVKGLVNAAATMIEKNVKRYFIQAKFKRIMVKERSYPSIKWIYSGKTVYVIGEMTRPHWVTKLKLKWCPVRGIYVKYFKAPLDPSKVYKYLYVVDGKYCFDANLPCVGEGTRYTTNYMVAKNALTVS